MMLTSPKNIKMETLKTITPWPWPKQRNPLLLSFSNGVTGVIVHNSSEKK